MKIRILVALVLLSHLVGRSVAQKSKEADRIIAIDMKEEKGQTSKVWQQCIGAGRANEGLRADWQEQLRQVKSECGFKYIRMHGLLHDDMGVYFEDDKGNPIYNWQYIDKLYDFLLSINMKPFVSLTFMPKALASGTKTQFWWKGNITPPKSYEKWGALIKALVEHFTERYGREEVKTWYFEGWNEPNLKDLFWTGDQQEFFKLYDTEARAIKSVCTDYKVGGPGSAGNTWIGETINYCKTNNCPIDFISTHNYGVKKGFLDETGKAGTVLNNNPKAITDGVIKMRKLIDSSAMPNLELHYTEWSASYTPTDPIHDSYHSAAFILDKIKGTENVANSMSYWVFTDIFEEMGPRATPFHGGFGLLNYQSIKKPAYYSFQFLNRLGNVELKNSDSASWVCKSSNGSIQALLWDFTITHPGDSILDQVYYKRDLPAKDKGAVQLKLKNIPQGGYTLKITKVGYKSNDAYATYMQMGSPSQLTKKQVETIKEANAGNPYITKQVEVKGDKLFTYQLPIRENDVYFVELEKR
jgi:xylan 1,4-beta-xylosidase